MKVESNQFIQLADIAIADPEVQAALEKGTNTADGKRLLVMSETNEEHGEALRHQAAAVKRDTLNRLPELLEQVKKQDAGQWYRRLVGC